MGRPQFKPKFYSKIKSLADQFVPGSGLQSDQLLGDESPAHQNQDDRQQRLKHAVRRARGKQ